MVTRVLRAVWLLSTAGLLAFTLATWNQAENRDLDLFMTWGMIVAAFPSSFAVVYICGALLMWAGTAIPTGRLGIALVWCVFFGAGYLQWFVLIPKLLRSRRRTDMRR